MCSHKTFNKRSTHEAPVHAEFMSCESRAAEEQALAICKHKQEDDLSLTNSSTYSPTKPPV